VMAPAFFKPATVADLVEFVRQVAAAAPDLPLLYYHFPTITGVNFTLTQFLDAAQTQIPTLRGAKFTSNDLWDFANSSAKPQKYDIMHGLETTFSASLLNGCSGWIGITFSLLAPVFTKLLNAFHPGPGGPDLATAAAAQQKIVDFFNVVDTVGGGGGQINISTLASIHKHLLQQKLGKPFGKLRSPLANLTPHQIELLDKLAKEYGFEAGVLSQEALNRI